MIKIRNGLLIAFVLFWVAMAGTLPGTVARAEDPRATISSAGSPGTETGEPDAGQGKQPPQTDPSTKPDRRRRPSGIGRLDWIHLARGMWAARYWGIGY